MDPRVTQIYEQHDVSVWWWVAFLTVAVVLTFVLIGIFLVGVTRAYDTSDETGQPASPDRAPLEGAEDEAAPAVEAPTDSHLSGVG
jgi:hypothetical protein